MAEARRIPRIVKGNDFEGLVPLKQFVTSGGETVSGPFPLNNATNVQVSLINESQRRYAVTWEIAPSRNDMLLLHVDGELTCGFWSLELTGRYEGDRIRTFIERLFEIVHSNEQADEYVSEDGDIEFDPITIYNNLTVSLGNVLEERGVADTMEQLYAAIILALNNKLSRTENDTANGHIRFLQGLTSETMVKLMGGADFGNFLSGYIGGYGGRIDGDGNGELESLMVRSFLEVPELRFNRVTVKVGDEWRTNGGGIVERVEPDLTGTGGYANTGTLWLHLEDGEAGTLQVNDKCKGIFHNLNGENDTATTDDGAGGRTFKGFCTTYFVVTGVYNDGGLNNRITYELRPCTSDGCWAHDPDEQTSEVRSTGIRGGFHPQAQMTVAQYSNATDTTRQSSTYYTTKYIRMLRQMTGWDEHLYNVGLQMGGMSLIESAYGTENERAAHATDYFLWIDGSICFSGTLDKVDSWGRPVEEYPDQGEFSLTADYYYNDLVHYNGIVWRCVYGERDSSGLYKKLRLAHATNENPNGENCVPGTDGHWVKYIYAQSLTPLGHWQSTSCPYPVNSIVNLGGSIYSSKIETSNPPMGLLLNGAGTEYVLNGEGGYIIVDETTNDDWELLLNVGDITNGAAGQDAITINLTNDTDSVFTDEHGNIPTGTVFPTTIAQLYEGMELIGAGVTWSIDWSKTTGAGTQASPLASINTTTGVVTTWGMSADKTIICIKATYRQREYRKEFTFHKTFGKDKLWIECDHNVIKYNPNTQVYSPMSLQVRAYIKRGSTGSVQEVTQASGFGYIRYSTNGQASNTVYHGGTITINDNSFIGDHLILTLYNADGQVEDVEDIPRVLDGLNAKTLLAEYSADRTNWHSTFTDGDLWMRTKQEGDDQWGDPIKIVGEDGEEMRYDFAISKSKVSASSTTPPTNISPAGWTDGPQEVTSEFPYLWMKMTPVDKEGNATGASKYVRLTGEKGQSSFKSTVFIRTNDQPSVPEGGSYENPVPTTAGWSDGIPAGDAILWASTRIFTSDGLSPQQAVWSTPRQQTDTATYDVEFSMSETQPAAPNNDNRADGSGNAATWYDPDKDKNNSHADWTLMNWRAERDCKNGVWGDWVITRVRGEKGDNGQSCFKSIVFMRSNETPARPTGGSYASPIPSTAGWTDGIPATPAGQIIWASSRIFTSDGLAPQQSQWSEPRQQSDTATYDVEFSMSETEPVAPNDENRADGNGLAATWYDTIKDKNNIHADWTKMKWRAERDCVNGVWGDWVISRIWGEKGDKGDKGDPGADGNGFASRGHWVTGTEAAEGDVFIFGDALYLTTQANTDVPPVMSLLQDGAGNRVLNGSGGYIVLNEATNTEYYTLWMRAAVTIVDKYVEYAIGENGQTPPETGWSTDYPTVDDGVYVWSRAVTVYSDGDTQTVYGVRRTGVDGDGIYDTKVYYGTTQSGLTMPADDWRVTWYDDYADLPELEPGSFLWTKTVLIYDKGDREQVTYQCGKIGQDGVGYLGTEEYYALSDSNETAPAGWNNIDSSTGKYRPLSPWSEARPTSSPNKATPYLWNFEISTDTEGHQQITQPICIGNFARGIAAIIELYAISAESVLSNTVKALTWTDEAYDAAPTDQKPYQWNKTITAYNDSTKTNGQWNEATCDVFFHISAVKGTKGTKGDFKSRVFKRTNTRPDPPTGGSYESPVPSGWSDGIPDGTSILWSSVCTFYGGGGSTGWSTPAQETDTDTLDIEFSPSETEPSAPQGNTPFSNHESEGWYDPSSQNFATAGTMIWRAERKVSNGQYDGAWVITRIYGEKGDDGESFAYKGHWHTGVEAKENDVFELAGSLYICTQENTDVPPVMSLLQDGAGNRVLNGEGGYVIINKAINSSYYSFFLEGYEQPVIPETVSVVDIEEYYARSKTNDPNTPPSVPVRQDNGKVYYDATVWNPGRPLLATDAEYPFLWNFELTTFSDGTQTFSYPHCIGNFADGVTDIENYYQISAKSQPETGREYPSDIVSWSQQNIVPTDLKPFQWNKEVIRMKGGSEVVSYHVSSVKGDTDTLDIEFSPSTTQPNAPTGNTPFANHESEGWYDPKSANFNNVGTMIWRAERKVRNGQYEADSSWVITRIYGQSSFKSTVFCRSNSKPNTPSGGSYANPIPDGWYDGIPDGTAIVWASSRIFTNDGQSPQQSQWSEPRQQTDTVDYDVEFSPNTNQPANPSDTVANRNSQGWYDPDRNPSFDFTTSIWRAERHCKNGVWGNWAIEKIKGEKGNTGQSSFKSTVFCRSNSASGPGTPTGGSYNSPVPTTSGWSDGIPEGTAILWASTRIFTSDGLSPQQSVWTTPRQQTDTADYDVEFSPNTTKPANPSDTVSQRNAQGWYDPDRNPSFDFTTSIWRAERHCKNGVWGNWAVEKIKGEKGDDGVHYYMDVSPKSAVKNVDGQFVSGSSISIRMYKQVGRNSPVLLTDFTECALQFTNNGTRTDIGWVASGVYAITIGTNVSSLTIKMVLQSDTSIILDTLNYNFITNGAQGLQGCVTRVTEWKANTEYRNDDGVDFSGSSQAIGYIDVVARPDDVNATGWKFYRCLRTHTSGSSFALTQSGYTVWQELSDVGPLYTSLLVAKNAYIKFGTGNQFVITTAGADKSSGTVSKPSGYTWQYSTDGSTWYTYSGGSVSKPSSGSVWFRLLDSSNAVISRVEIPVLPTSGYSLVVDKNYDTVLKTDDGVIRDTLTEIKAYIYNGQNQVYHTAGTWSITGSGCTVDYSGASGNAKLIKVTNVTSDSASVTIKCTYSGTQKTYTVSLVRRKENVKYAISPSVVAALSSTSSIYAYLYSWTKTDKVVAGMRGTGIFDDSIRFWAGSTSESNIASAPFRVTHAGKLYATNAEITGVITATGGTIDNVIATNINIKGSQRSPFSFVNSNGTFNESFTDNMSVRSTSYGATSYNLPWNTSQSGRKVTIVNWKDWNGNESISSGYAQLSAPSGKYFFEDGIQKSTLKLSREAVELIGYGNDDVFFGWVVLKRIDLGTESKYGHPMKMLAVATVEVTKIDDDHFTPSISYHTFDGSTMSVSRTEKGIYVVTWSNNSWFKDSTSVFAMVCGYGTIKDYNATTPLYASVKEKTRTSITIQVADDDSRNDGGFSFFLMNFDDWVYIV